MKDTVSLIRLVRSASGKVHMPNEKGRIIRRIENLDRQLLYVKFDDGETVILKPEEVQP